MNWTRLQAGFEENPTATLLALAAAATAVGKLVDTVASARSKNAYARQVNRALRTRMR